MSNPANKRWFPRALFVLYCAAMLWLLFGQRWGQYSPVTDAHLNINLIPMKTIKQYISLLNNETYRTHAIINLAGNVLVFVPLGYLLPKIWKAFRLFIATVLSVAILVIIIEFLQYATGLGSCDIDDLILNVPGVSAGYIIWKLRKK